DADVQTDATHLSDTGNTRRDALDLGEQAVADGPRVREQVPGGELVEDRLGGGDADRVAAEGVEVADVAAKRAEQLRRGDHGGDRQPVAHRLAENDQVGLDAVTLEGPPVGPRAAEAGLYLIRDEYAAGLVHDVARGSQLGPRLEAVTGQCTV